MLWSHSSDSATYAVLVQRQVLQVRQVLAQQRQCVQRPDVVADKAQRRDLARNTPGAARSDAGRGQRY